jgi:hypothetical protein
MDGTYKDHVRGRANTSERRFLIRHLGASALFLFVLCWTYAALIFVIFAKNIFSGLWTLASNSFPADTLYVKNPNAPAVQREAKEDWGRQGT